MSCTSHFNLASAYTATYFVIMKIMLLKKDRSLNQIQELENPRDSKSQHNPCKNKNASENRRRRRHMCELKKWRDKGFLIGRLSCSDIEVRISPKAIYAANVPSLTCIHLHIEGLFFLRRTQLLAPFLRIIMYLERQFIHEPIFAGRVLLLPHFAWLQLPNNWHKIRVDIMNETISISHIICISWNLFRFPNE